MKIKFCLIFSFILQFTLFSQVNWQSKNPYPQTDLRSVYFFNTNTGLVCGSSGFVYKTTNAGYSWIAKTTPTSRSLNSIWFYNSTNGIAVGDTGTVIITTDAGESWSLQTPVTTYNIKKLFYYDTNNAFAVCSNGRLLKSSNSGSNWTEINLNVTELFEMDFFNNTIYLGSTNSKYFKSTDSGNNWILTTPGVSNTYIYQVHFISQDTGIMLTNNYSSYKTVNGGLNWTQILSGLFIPSYAVFSDNKFGLGSGNSMPIVQTTNGGQTWISIGPSNYLSQGNYSVIILDTNNLYAAGLSGKILHHINDINNTTWDITGGSLNNCIDISFSGNDRVAIVGSQEQVWLTTNGGNKWNIKGMSNNGYFEGPNTYVRSVYCKDSNTIYVTKGDGYAGHGYTGSILVSNDGGISWTTSLYEIYAEYYKIGGAGNTVLCNFGNKIINNSGGGWYDYLTESQYNLKNFSFINENTGIIISYPYSGNVKKIFSTTNNGLNWTIQTSNRILNGVHLRNSGVGIICCDSGRVLRTSDFGITWNEYTSSTNKELYDIYMKNDGVIWAVGSLGLMLYSTNSGVNWVTAPSFTSNNLNKIIFTDQNTGYAAGEYGTILKTTDGGLTFVNTGSHGSPSEFSLGQNFPNPFNPVTSIKFSVPGTCIIKIEIFDIEGKLIDILTDNEYSPGIYTVEWNASEHSSGIYFYKFTASGFTETKKMILIK